MATYKYKAQDEYGKICKGNLSAIDEQDLHNRLKEEKKYLLQASEVKGNDQKRALKSKQIADYCRQLGTLISAGVSLVRALKIISESEGIKPAERAIYESVLILIRQGRPLCEAMEMQNGAFPSILINMFRSAEMSGNLDRTAMHMADYFEKQFRLNSKVKSSMTYPKILGVLIVAVIIVIMTYVIPQFQSLFEQMETLPVSTTILLAISGFISSNWLGIIIALVIAIIALTLIMKIPAVLMQKDKLLVHLPIFGKLEKIIFTARFARTLSSMYSSGIPIVTSLTISKKTIGNYYIEKQFDDVIATVRTGGSLSEALSAVDGFTKKLSATIQVGEQTGNLDAMLNSTADSLDYEAEMAIGKMVSYLEPAMIVVMAVIVGFIIISVIQPIYGSYETIGQSSY